MRFRLTIIRGWALFALAALVSCNSNQPVDDLTKQALIPKPHSVTSVPGSFELGAASAIFVETPSPDLLRLGQYLAEKLKPATGFSFSVAEGKGDSTSGNHIYLSLDANNPVLGSEGYQLAISANSLRLKANQAAGIFMGMQTILQLLPDAVASPTKQDAVWRIPGGTISDHPEYEYRGTMLDVSRHFFGIDDVKRYIDLIAFYKMNVLHLHLSDDQGWRIEIKSWPNLATHGGSTQVGGGKGGFYTQEQYKDIVKYAQDRYVTIVPEIDLPGHTNAALASYAELNCSDTARELYTKTEVGFSTLCVPKEITYKFIDDVVRELAAITPGPYIHLGGDESHATKKEDYISFVNRIQSIPKKYGKQMIGWEEIAQGNLDSSTIVQFWTNPLHAEEAVRKGAKILMSPATKVYLDMKYDSLTKLGQDWAARIELDSAYIWSLSSQVKGILRESILGVEAPLWTETILSMDDIEFMVFPRLPGIAEIGWSSEEGRTWEDYRSRIGKHGSRMKAMGINYYPSKMVDWAK